VPFTLRDAANRLIIVVEAFITTSPRPASSIGCQVGTAHICCRAPCCGAVAAHRACSWYVETGAGSCRSIYPARRALSSKPAAAAANRRDTQTDRQTDARPLHRPGSAYCAERCRKGLRRDRTGREARCLGRRPTIDPRLQRSSTAPPAAGTGLIRQPSPNHQAWASTPLEHWGGRRSSAEDARTEAP